MLEEAKFVWIISGLIIAKGMLGDGIRAFMMKSHLRCGTKYFIYDTQINNFMWY
jgi:hypothetical protein